MSSGSDALRPQLYTEFIKSFQDKMNQIRLVVICDAISAQFNGARATGEKRELCALTKSECVQTPPRLRRSWRTS